MEGTPNSCPRCPVDSCQPNEGAISCNVCPFPTTALLEGQVGCSNYSLKTPVYGFYIVLSVAVFVYLCCMALTGLSSIPLIAFRYHYSQHSTSLSLFNLCQLFSGT